VFYHVRITPRGGQRPRQDALAVDKDAGWIEERIAAPRRQGQDIFVDGRVFAWADVEQIHITETGQTVAELVPQLRARRTEKGLISATPDEWFVVNGGREVSEQFITGLPGTGPRATADKASTFAADRKAVMVIYGHDTQANDALFGWLRAIGLRPREWSQLIQASGSASPYIGDVLDKALQQVQAVVAFFTPDEYVTAAHSHGDSAWRLQARPNVLIEAGMALIAHPTRTVIVVLGNQELPSDLAGRHYVRLSPTAVEPLHDLAERLRTAGCDTDTTGTAWLDPTRFPDRNTTKPPPGNPKPTASQPVSDARLRSAHRPQQAQHQDTLTRALRSEQDRQYEERRPVLEGRLMPWPDQPDTPNSRLEVRIKSHHPLAMILVNVPAGIGLGLMSYLLQVPEPGRPQSPLRPWEWILVGRVHLSGNSDKTIGTVTATAKCRDEYGTTWDFVELPISLGST
jgi:predicted nucleotide-binding protein